VVLGLAFTGCTSSSSTTPSCVASPVAGTACTPSIPACSTGPCAAFFCTAGGVWEVDQGCIRPLDAGHDSSASHPDAQTGCVNLVSGGPCAPNGFSCQGDGCNTFLCSAGIWLEERLCTVDGGAPPVDSGHDSEPSCTSGGAPCSSNTECCGGTCSQDVCCLPVNTTCKSAAQCCPPLFCNEGSCSQIRCIQDGGACGQLAGACCGGVCNSQSVCSPCVVSGGLCSNDDQCCGMSCAVGIGSCE
jgi:hypothetical protein